MAVWFDIASEPFFVMSISALPAPADASVLPALKQIQHSNLPFPVFAHLFRWRLVPIPTIDTFPGNDDPLYAFDIQTGAKVTVIKAKWNGGDGVMCLTAY